MSAPPKTVLTADAEEAERIRSVVRGADVAAFGPGRVLAAPHHAAAVLDLLLDPAVSDPIYDLPRPFTIESVKAWIGEAEAKRQKGETLLILNHDPQGGIAGYSRITVWPDRSSAELGGALRANLQNSGSGGAGAAQIVAWIFDVLQVRLMCLTAALDNIRSQRMIDRIGFVRMGERDSVRPDGSIRRSVYWEMTREQWLAVKAAWTSARSA